MSEIDDRPLSDDEREEQERRRREGRPTLDEEIVRRYQPDSLRRLVGEHAGRGEQMDLATRSAMERLLPGHDFSKVRLFRGPLAEEVTRRHSADAVTVGNTGVVLVRQTSRAAPGTTPGHQLLAHELTHVAQAQRGMQFAKEGGGGELEEEAEEMEADAGADDGTGDGASRGSDSGSSPDTERGGGTSAQARKTDAKRKAIIERVVELMTEYARYERARVGE
jgi:hypothetical protein